MDAEIFKQKFTLLPSVAEGGGQEHGLGVTWKQGDRRQWERMGKGGECSKK